MNKTALSILNLLLLVLLQIFIFNYIHLFGFINPQIYLLGILLLPVNLNKNVQYLIAFAAGFILDLFFQTYGIFASATLTLAFFRLPLISMLTGFQKSDEVIKISASTQNFTWLLIYIFPLIFTQQLLVNFIEIFDKEQTLFIFLSSLINSILTTFIILSLLYIFRKKIKKDN